MIFIDLKNIHLIMGDQKEAEKDLCECQLSDGKLCSEKAAFPLDDPYACCESHNDIKLTQHPKVLEKVVNQIFALQKTNIKLYEKIMKILESSKSAKEKGQELVALLNTL